MKIVAKTSHEELATVYIAEMDHGKRIECVESVQPPIPREKKWVLIVSTLYGCPVGCRFCDAGHQYQGKLTQSEIMAQIDYMVRKRFRDGCVPIPKFKIQFARMGEPALNEHVLDVLEILPERIDAPGLLPTLSTVAPTGSERFFDRLLDIKERIYPDRFQLQFSIHTTDKTLRDWLVPVKKWDLSDIAEYGKLFCQRGGRKITLNFALAKDMVVDPDVLLKYFPPEQFLMKITPVNPTYRAEENQIRSLILPDQKKIEIIDRLQDAGYDVILSIGELEENHIGSNCGQYLTHYLMQKKKLSDGYTYPLQSVDQGQAYA